MHTQSIPPLRRSINPYTNTHCRNRELPIPPTINGNSPRAPV